MPGVMERKTDERTESDSPGHAIPAVFFDAPVNRSLDLMKLPSQIQVMAWARRLSVSIFYYQMFR
jgi:hypothetical protein